MALAQSSPAAALAGQDFHEDTAVKWLLIGSVSYFAIVGIIALIIAAKFVWPQFLGTIPYFTYGRMRPVHVNGMLFGWLLQADMGLAFFLVPRLCGVKLWSEKLGVATSILWNIIILSAVVTLLGGYQKGIEYADLPTWVACLVVVAWIMFGIKHLYDHCQSQVRPDVRVHLVLHGHHPVDSLRLSHWQLRHDPARRDRRQPGQPDLDVHAQRGRV